MRISDWSSDVCSSDLCRPACRWTAKHAPAAVFAHLARPLLERARIHLREGTPMPNDTLFGVHAAALEVRSKRSEEHTSELQSLLRISYAVFCLKKKKNTR